MGAESVTGVDVGTVRLLDRGHLPKIRLRQRTHPPTQLLVVGCLLLIFALNQFDPAYIKFTLALLCAS